MISVSNVRMPECKDITQRKDSLVRLSAGSSVFYFFKRLPGSIRKNDFLRAIITVNVAVYREIFLELASGHVIIVKI